MFKTIFDTQPVIANQKNKVFCDLIFLCPKINMTYPHCKRFKLTGFQQKKAGIVDKSVDTVDKHLFASHNSIIVDNFFQ